MEYVFESEQFAFSKDALHLLRSRFNYKTYPNGQIQQIKLEQGKLITNWLLILILGVAMIGFSIFYSITIYQQWVEGSLVSIYIEELVVPILPLFLGFYALYTALRNGPIAIITFTGNKSKKFPLDSLLKDHKIDQLIIHLNESPELKGKATVSI